VKIRAVGIKKQGNRLFIGGEEVAIGENPQATEITGSLSDIARKGLREPVLVTKRGKPVIARCRSRSTTIGRACL